MKVPIASLLLIFFVNKTSGDLVSKLESLSKSESKLPVYHVKEKLIADLITNRVTDSIVVVTASYDQNLIRSIMTTEFDTIDDDMNKTLALTNLQPDAITNILLEDIKLLNIKLNRQSFYILLLDNHQEVVELIKQIQLIDWDSKIAVIYPEGFEDVRIYEDLKIYNIYLFVEDAYRDDASYRIYDICRFCGEDSTDLINFMGTWKMKTGFKKMFTFQASFRGNFFGKEVGMGLFYLRPNVHPIGTHANGSVILDGTSYRVYEIIAEMLNFKIRVVNWSGKYNLYFWAYTYHLHHKVTDIVGGGWNCRYPALQVADVSVIESTTEGYRIISVEPLKGIDPLYAYVAPFDGYIWGLLLASVLLAGLTLFILRKLCNSPDKEANPGDAIWDAIIVACWESIRCPHPSWGIIIHLSCYLLGYFLLISLYLGEYSAALIIGRYLKPPIDTLDQFWSSDMQWVTGHRGEYGSWINFFQENPMIKDRNFNVSLLTNEPFQAQALRKVSENPNKLVYFGQVEAANSLIRLFKLKPKNREFYYSKESFRSGFTCLHYRKNWYAKEMINRKLLLVRDMGIPYGAGELYMTPLITKPTLEQARLKVVNEFDGLIQFKHFVVGFYTCLIFYGLGLILVVIEVIKSKVQPAKVKNIVKTIDAGIKKTIKRKIKEKSKIDEVIEINC